MDKIKTFEQSMARNSLFIGFWKAKEHERIENLVEKFNEKFDYTISAEDACLLIKYYESKSMNI